MIRPDHCIRSASPIRPCGSAPTRPGGRGPCAGSRSPGRGSAGCSGQVGPVDGVPEVLGLPDRLLRGQLGVPGEVGARVAERGVAQRQEPVHVPVPDVVGVGVDVDREVEEVADRQSGGAVGSRPAPAAARSGPRRSRCPAAGPSPRRPARCRRPGGCRPAPSTSSVPDFTSITKRSRARRSYDSGKPLRCISPRRSSSALGSRNPSVVTRLTRGCSGQAASSSRSSRAVVDLPTATEPAMPITNGVRPTDELEELVGRAVQLAGVQHVAAEQPGQRQVDLADVVHAGRVAESAEPLQGRRVQGHRGLLGQLGPVGPAALHVRAERPARRAAWGAI